MAPPKSVKSGSETSYPVPMLWTRQGRYFFSGDEENNPVTAGTETMTNTPPAQPERSCELSGQLECLGIRVRDVTDLGGEGLYARNHSILFIDEALSESRRREILRHYLNEALTALMASAS